MNRLKPLLMAGVFALPVNQLSNWQILEYSRLKPNQVEFSQQGMMVNVDHSASPVIFPLPAPVRVSRVRVEGQLSALLKLPKNKQGHDGVDDFSLKLGLVVKGDKTLNGFQRMFSSKWVKTLFDLAPEGVGVDRVQFLSAVQTPEMLAARAEAGSDLFQDEYVWLLDKPGAFTLEHKLKEPLEVIAVWVSIDGDDSGSKYSMLIKQLELID